MDGARLGEPCLFAQGMLRYAGNMDFPTLTPALLLRRYQRFMADCRLENGDVVTAHCANSGTMRSCAEPGQAVLLSFSNNGKRKLPWTWELYWSGASWVCVNTQRPNAVVAEGISNGQIGALGGYGALRREVAYGERERVDILLTDPQRPPCYVEVKSCTMLDRDGVTRFPDAVTERGRRHLRALTQVVREGGRGVMCFLIGREDGQGFAPADDVDPAYGLALREARAAGVEILAYRTRITVDKISISGAERLLF